MTSTTLMRDKIDGLRLQFNSGELNSSDLEVQLESMCATSDLDATGTHADKDHLVSDIHMCPWHTCQATRHG
ncbi:hypothetical protein [Gimesia sp.]|uniref:hypothetical protein n=1 Tax=Gimesia sp. TaxID=2024833 RepID=UPI0032EFA997